MNNSWAKVFSRPHTIQRVSFLWPFFTSGAPKDRKVRMHNFLLLPNGEKHDYYFKRDEWRACLERISWHLLNESTEEQEKEFYQHGEKLVEIAKRVFENDLGKWSNEELKEWFAEYSKEYAKYSYYALSPWAIDLILAPKLLKELEKM